MSDHGEVGTTVAGIFLVGMVGIVIAMVVDTMTTGINRAEIQCLASHQVEVLQRVYNKAYGHMIRPARGRGTDDVEQALLDEYIEPTGEKFDFFSDGYHYRYDGFRLKDGYCIEINALINHMGNISQIEFLSVKKESDK